MVWIRNYFVHTAGPNTALIKSSGKRDVRVVIGGRILAAPIIQRVDRLGLELRTIAVHTTRGTTINGVGVDVTSCCQVKIQGWSATSEDSDPTPHHSSAGGDLHMDYSAIRLAAQHFIGMKDGQIEDAIKKTVAGHQRAIIGVLTVEQLYRDRNEFSKRVLDLCYKDMRNMGLTIVSYTVAEITDELGYIEALGVRQTELVKREATEGAALHQSQALARKAQEEAAAHLEVNRQKEREVESDKLRAIRQAEAQQRIDRHVAIQQKAHAISTAEQDAVLLVQRKKAYAAEAEAELLVMRQKVEREKLLKEQMIHVEADARLYKAKIEAEGIRATAAADGDRIKMLGEAEAAATAEKVKQKGMAEVNVAIARAKAIRAQGVAESENLRQRLEIWQECGNQGVILDEMIHVLPEVARSVAEPLAKTEKMVFVGSGNSGGGPSNFTKEMNRMVAEVPETVHALTGFDMRQGIADFVGGKTRDADVGICSNEGRTLGSEGRPCGLGQVMAAALSAVKTKLVFARNREFEGR